MKSEKHSTNETGKPAGAVRTGRKQKRPWNRVGIAVVLVAVVCAPGGTVVGYSRHASAARRSSAPGLAKPRSILKAAWTPVT